MVQTHLDLATINQLAKALPEPPLVTSHHVSLKYAFLAYFEHSGIALDTHQVPFHFLEVIAPNTPKTSHFRQIGDLTSKDDIRGGEVFLCPANTDHKVQWEQKSNFSILIFNSKSIEYIANKLGIYHTVELIPQISLRDPKLLELVLYLQATLKMDYLSPERMSRIGDEVSEEILQYLITNFAISSLKFKRSRHSRQSQGRLSEFQIEQVREYIHEYLRQDQDLPDPDVMEQELASILGVDPAKIKKLIEKSTGLKLPRYINLQKLEYSKYLLTQDYSITEVAFKCDYNDSNYFARQFKKEFGINPSQFRRQQQKILVDFGSYANPDHGDPDSLTS